MHVGRRAVSLLQLTFVQSKSARPRFNRPSTHATVVCDLDLHLSTPSAITWHSGQALTIRLTLAMVTSTLDYCNTALASRTTSWQHVGSLSATCPVQTLLRHALRSSPVTSVYSRHLYGGGDYRLQVSRIDTVQLLCPTFFLLLAHLHKV